MKKLLILILPFFIISCGKSSNELFDYENSIFDPEISISNDNIQKIALEHINEITLKNNSNKSITIVQIDTTFKIKDKKGRNAINIFKYKNNSGWNIISGDNRLYPILAYNNSGDAELDTSQNPGLKFWVEDIIQQIDFMDKNSIKQDDKIKYQWEKHLRIKKNASNLKKEPISTPFCPSSNTYWATYHPETYSYEGLTNLKWGQTSGYNYYMPYDNCDPLSYYCNKYPAGCGPVAIGMLMHYYKKPNDFIFYGEQRVIGYHLMPQIIYYSNVNCNYPNSGQEELAALLRFVSGKHADLWCFSVSLPFYYSGKSVTALYTDKIIQTFGDWGYSNSGDKIDYYENPNHTRLIQNLKQRKPVIF